MVISGILMCIRAPASVAIYRLQSNSNALPTELTFIFRLTNALGTISDGAGNYSVGVKCSWLIDARDHSLYTNSLRNSIRSPTIRLHLEEFATECGWDHLYVYDGDSVESPLLAVFR